MTILMRPTGTNSDDYYKRVAAAYSQALQLTSAPCAMLARESGVPATTVHRWVREARRSGHLPPARKGLAGQTTALERVAADLGIDPGRLREAIRRHAKGGLR